MKNGRFTPEERRYLLTLDAVDEVRAGSVAYSKGLKAERMMRYNAGEKPGAIFASAGLPASFIGYKRIERAISRWKEAQLKDALLLADAPQVRHRNQVDTIKREKREAIERQREVREREIGELEDKSAKQKQRAKERGQRIVAAQAAEIAALKAQVKALKALGTLSRRTQRAPQTTRKPERFELISQLKSEGSSLSIGAVRKALEVSRRGYHGWPAAADAREKGEVADLVAKAQTEQAMRYRGFQKGARRLKGCMRRKQGLVMNRKKIQRISRKHQLICKPKRKRPYCPIGADGQPKVAPNAVNRNFRGGMNHKVPSTDITYLPVKDGFDYLSAIIDCETDAVLAHVTSTSLEEKFVLDTYNQLKGIEPPEDAWACSDQGVHYTARAYREKLAELGIKQSMSRKACCWGNAPIESFWGRMKEQVGATENLTHKQVVKLVDDYIDYYNNERGQARLGWLTPVEYARKLAA